MPKAAFIYSDALSRHVLRDDHPMRPSRLRYTYELLEGYEAFKHPSALLVEPREATVDELLLVHSRDYVEAVRTISNGERSVNPLMYNFSSEGDNPPYRGMYEAALLSTGASIVAMQMVLDGKVDAAFNVSGGLHHAARSSASGFCIFNDPAVIVAHMVNQGLKVLYLDIDAHHGDGVQNAFYDSNRVLTISFHEAGRWLFPGTGETSEIGTGEGRGYAVNMPLSPYAGDDAYLGAFESLVPPLMSSFQPDIVVAQLGVDAHYLDPLAHLHLTTNTYSHVLKYLIASSPKLIAVGGGGYDMGAVPRVWALEYGLLLGEEWPDEIPADFQERYGIKSLRDTGSPELDQEKAEFVRKFAEQGVEALRREVFPFHRL